MAKYNDHTKYFLWCNLRKIEGVDPDEYRRDYYGHTIKWLDYGNRNSKFGWEIDHVIPEMLGGTNALSNLRALHWRPNAIHGGSLSSLINKRK